MEFGKLVDTSGVDWELPADSFHTRTVLASQTRHGDFKVYIGSTAWGQEGFIGPIYPILTKASERLAAYGAQFNAIELNTTFYRIPDRRQVMKWAFQTPSDFRFCPKVNKRISQAPDLAIQTSFSLDFAKAIQHFEQRLGPCFIQLPGDFSTDSWAILERWLECWPRHLSIAVEFRHPSWFAESRAVDAFAKLATLGVGSVITDVAGRRDAAHMQLSSGFTMVRWVGTLEPSDETRLEQWAQRLIDWGRHGLQAAYIFTHQPEELPSALSALKLHELLLQFKKGLDIDVRAPQLRAAEPGFPQQGELFAT